MKAMRTLAVTTLFALLLPFLAACGGGEPATMASIPTFPTATELQTGQNPMADTLAETMKSAISGNLKSDVKLYELPADATWDQVKSFYSEALGSGDWKAATELDTSNEALSTTGWKRGSLASEQVLMVGFMPALLGGAPVMIVSLFSE